MPDELVFEDGERMVIAPPDGDLTNEKISPAEAIVVRAENETPTYTFVIQLETDDLETIERDGGRFFYTTVGLVAPFQFDTITGR